MPQNKTSLCKVLQRLVLLKYQERESNPHGLEAHRILSPACLPIPPSRHLRKKHRWSVPFRGAKDGVRTRDLDLGKVALYQLSYFRIYKFAVFRRIVMQT